ncbi:MAG: DoxX family protein [Cyclonatronaceae bacterium]
MYADLIVLKERIEGYRHYLIELIRILFGLFLMGKGYGYVENPSELAYFITLSAMPLSADLLIHYIVAAHVAGGLLIALGLYTRTVLLIQIPVLLGVILMVHAQNGPFTNGLQFETAVVTFLLLTGFLYYGSGRWSLDHLVLEKRERPHS